MFDFEKLEVYQKLRETNVVLLKHLYQNNDLDLYLKDQLKRASLGAMFNLSEGVGRMTTPDKKRFITMSRSSVFETVSILQILLDMGMITPELYNNLYTEYTSVSKMLLAMFRSYNDRKF